MGGRDRFDLACYISQVSGVRLHPELSRSMEPTMTRHHKAALLTAAVVAAFIGLQIGLNVQTGLAGLFIMGMAGDILIGDEMSRDAKAAGQPGTD